MRTTKEFYFVIFYFLLSGLFMFLDSRNFFVPARSILQKVNNPIRKELYVLKLVVQSPFSVIAVLQDKTKKIEDLELKVAQISASLADFKSLQEENARMRLLLDAGPLPNLQFTPARVVSMASDVILVLDGEKTDTGTAVIYPQESSTSGFLGEGIFVGRVEEKIGQNTKILMPTHPLSKIPVILRDLKTGERHGSGIVIGKGGRMVVDQVLNKEIILEGDLILTSGESSIPPDLLIGYASKVNKNKGSIWQQAEVKPALTAKNLDYVFLITKY